MLNRLAKIIRAIIFDVDLFSTMFVANCVRSIVYDAHPNDGRRFGNKLSKIQHKLTDLVDIIIDEW